MLNFPQFFSEISSAVAERVSTCATFTMRWQCKTFKSLITMASNKSLKQPWLYGVPSPDVTTSLLTLNMTSTQVVETSVTVTNSSFLNYNHPEDHTRQTTEINIVVSLKDVRTFACPSKTSCSLKFRLLLPPQTEPTLHQKDLFAKPYDHDSHPSLP